MSKFKGFMIFAFGAAVGSVATWKYLKTTYEQIAQEEIDSVKAAFMNKEHAVEAEPERTIPKVEKNGKTPNVMDFTGRSKTKDGYIDYSNLNEDDAMVVRKKVEKPYVITPDEFGEFESYTKISLTYYADKVLADENDEIVEDVDEVVGFESLNHIGEYENDSVHVRNDMLKCDYEILLDQREYSEVLKTKPRQVEVE